MEFFVIFFDSYDVIGVYDEKVSVGDSVKVFFSFCNVEEKFVYKVKWLDW